MPFAAAHATHPSPSSLNIYIYIHEMGGDMTLLSGLFRTARKEGLGVTLHIAEVRYRLFRPYFSYFLFSLRQRRENSTVEETKELLSCEPERLGHATFLDDEA